jgi:hypothetical protein
MTTFRGSLQKISAFGENLKQSVFNGRDEHGKPQCRIGGQPTIDLRGRELT